MKSLFGILFLFIFVYGSNIDDKIIKTNKKIENFSKSYTSLNKKMASTAKAILKQKQILLKQQKELKILKEELKNKEKSYKVNIEKLKELKKSQDNLQDKQNAVKQELVFVIAQNISLSVILSEDYAVDEKSLIEFEVLQKMMEESNKKAKLLNEQFFSNSKRMDNLAHKVTNLEISISDMDKKRKKLVTIQEKNKKSLKMLELAKSNYKKELKKLLN
ncbi:MAG: peptidase M23, partial [Campylobacterales bacterium]